MVSSSAPARPHRAIVLSGGGARGAYEAGVLRFLFEELPKDLGGPARLDVVAGTSVGAIHACFVAATAHLEAERSRLLDEVWKELEPSLLFGSIGHELLQLPRNLLRVLRAPRTTDGEPPPERLFGLLDTRKLEHLVQRSIPWEWISKNLRAGRLDAVSVAATEIATGRVVAFVQSDGLESARWTHDTSIISRPASLRPEHALASAAIPFLFPAVRVENTYFTDGGLRLNTPLAPALRLGADRILVVALRDDAMQGASAELEARRIEHFGSPLFLFGKVLNALLLDHVETNLAHMHVINDVLRRVASVAGRSVLEQVNAEVARDRGHPFRIVEDVVVRPSRDLGRLAGEIAQASSQGRHTSAGVRFLLDALGFDGSPLEADLLSYLYFDRSFTRPLMELGFEDAAKKRDDLVAFFTD